jgi:transcriptional regulator with XRE-family HTH domain
MELYGNKNIVHKRLKAARKKARLSQGDLAAKLQTMNVNIDQQMISRIERNQRIVTDFEVVCFAKALNLNALWLLSGHEDVLQNELKNI